MDTIGDFLTILRNASSAKKWTCHVPASRLREGILNILKSEGYIADFKAEEDDRHHRYFVVFLKYVQGSAAIVGLQRCSKPGCRLYYAKAKIPKVLGGLGTVILTTSRGILKGADAAKQNIGGELLCKVW
ncbi:MAG: 30S ribosomal protein S8 [Puniceicoccales bacterium]|jgi:small subunit ribosomal protein S8|nr:30S ribosomal protein S8 [Puniceicoccales bacterium]